MAETKEVKKLVIGGVSYDVCDQSARDAAAAAKKAADGVNTSLGSYVKTADADKKYETITNVNAVKTSVSNLTTATNPAFKSVAFDSAKRVLNFTTVDGTTVPLDVTAFTKDAMLKSAEIKDYEYTESSGKVTKKSLVLTVKTENGGTVTDQVIAIPIADIFNADNYYTKTQVDTKVADATKGIASETNVKSWIATAKKEATDYTDELGNQMGASFFKDGVNNLIYADADDSSKRKFNTGVANDVFAIIKKNASGEMKASASIDLSDGKQGTLAYTDDIPTKVGALTNDAGYVNTITAEYNASEKTLSLGVAYQVAPA